MKKRIFAVLTAFVLLTACLPLGAVNVSAQSFDEYNDMYYYTTGYGIGIYGMTHRGDSVSNLVIPEEIDGMPVTELSGAFWDCPNLVSLSLPSSLIYMNDGIFTNCDKLKTITVHKDNRKFCAVDNVLFNKKMTVLYVYASAKKESSYTVPDSVVEVKGKAFDNSDNLTSVTLPKGITAISNQMFYDCDKLSSIVIPSGVTEIQEAAFYGCDQLSTITLSKNLKHFDTNVINDCGKLAAIHVEKGNEKYVSQDGVLYNADKTTLIRYPVNKTGKVNFLKSVTEIGESAFKGCVGLSSLVIPKEIKRIGTESFAGSSLTSVTVEAADISSGAFSFCKKLTSAVLPYGLSIIADQLFDGCSALTSVTFGNTITDVWPNAFKYCISLQDVYFLGTAEDKAKINVCDENDALFDAEWHYKTPPTTTTTTAKPTTTTKKSTTTTTTKKTTTTTTTTAKSTTTTTAVQKTTTTTVKTTTATDVETTTTTEAATTTTLVDATVEDTTTTVADTTTTMMDTTTAPTTTIAATAEVAPTTTNEKSDNGLMLAMGIGIGILLISNGVLLFLLLKKKKAE